MKHNITDEGNFSFASITDPHSHTIVAYLSADIHGEETLRSRAIELLYADALISGAGKYSREAFLDAVNTLGASISVNITDGVFMMHLKASASTTRKIVELVETMLTAPHFSATELKRIKQTVINFLKEGKENTNAIAHEQLRNTIYGVQDRRYTFAEDDLIRTIPKISPKDLQALHKKVMSLPWTCSVASAPQNVTLLHRSITKLKKAYSKITTSEGIHQQKPPQPTLVLKDVPSKQNIDFSIGAPVPITLHHPDFIPLKFAITVLGGGGFGSRLMSSVRAEEGLTYDIFSRPETFLSEEQGYWRIGSFFAPEKTIQGLTSTYREVTHLYEKGITDEELKLFKQNIATKEILLNDSTLSMLRTLHSYHRQKFSLQEIEERNRRLQSLTTAEVNEVICRYLNPKMLTISGAGPVSSVKKDLQAFMKSVS